MVHVKPVDDNQAGALVLEEQDIVLHIARYAVAVSHQLLKATNLRLEDLLGAVAVALPPGEGLGALVGGTALHPLTGLTLPVVASNIVHGIVNPALGPSHFQLCVENQLLLVSAFKHDGLVAEGHGAYVGLSRGAAAVLIRKELEQRGVYRGEEDAEEEVLRSRWGDIVTVLRGKEVSAASTSSKADNLRRPILCVSRSSDDSVVSFSADLNVAAVDNKVTAVLTGRTGAFCTACRSQSTDMHGSRAAEPFFMDMDFEEVTINYHSLCEKLLGDGGANTDGVLPSAKGDYDSRFGQKQRPLAINWDPTKVLSVLHASLLNLVKWLFNLVCRVAAGCPQWNPGKRLPLAWRQRLEHTTKVFHTRLGPILGFLGKSAPNQLPGNLARKFLAEKNRDAVIKMLHELGTHCPDSGVWHKLTQQETDTYRSIFRDLGIIGRVASSDGLVRIFKLRNFCSQVHVTISDAFPWCLVGESVHRLLNYIWELCLLNDCHGLARLSESGFESVHKVEMYDREHQARKTSLVDNVRDIFTHQTASSDPVVRSFDKKPLCSRCWSVEHHTVSCPIGCPKNQKVRF